jgi:hypothetical protein
MLFRTMLHGDTYEVTRGANLGQTLGQRTLPDHKASDIPTMSLGPVNGILGHAFL